MLLRSRKKKSLVVPGVGWGVALCKQIGRKEDQSEFCSLFLFFLVSTTTKPGRFTFLPPSFPPCLPLSPSLLSVCVQISKTTKRDKYQRNTEKTNMLESYMVSKRENPVSSCVPRPTPPTPPGRRWSPDSALHPPPPPIARGGKETAKAKANAAGGLSGVFLHASRFLQSRLLTSPTFFIYCCFVISVRPLAPHHQTPPLPPILQSFWKVGGVCPHH